MLGLLQQKKNIALQRVPGCGISIRRRDLLLQVAIGQHTEQSLVAVVRL